MVQKLTQEMRPQAAPPSRTGDGDVFDLPLAGDGASHQKSHYARIFLDYPHCAVGRKHLLILLRGPLRRRDRVRCNAHHGGKIGGSGGAHFDHEEQQENNFSRELPRKTRITDQKQELRVSWRRFRRRSGADNWRPGLPRRQFLRPAVSLCRWMQLTRCPAELLPARRQHLGTRVRPRHGHW